MVKTRSGRSVHPSKKTAPRPLPQDGVPATAHSTNRQPIYVLLVFLGVAARLWLWWNSVGCNDTHIWATHGTFILQHGVAAAYQKVAIFNHPPLMGYWAAFAVFMSHGNLWTFSLWMRAPGLLADFGTIVALWRLASPAAASIYACSPVAVFISAFHGNTDALCAFAILLAAMALDRRRWFTAGVLLAIALNVKVIPLMLVPIALACAIDLRALCRLSAGLSLAIVPFVPPALSAAAAMRRNILEYLPTPDQWGIVAFLFPAPRAWYVAHARFIIMGAIVALALLSRLRLHLAASAQFAIGVSLFLVLTPGFGIQYLLYATPFLCLVNNSSAILWAITAGAFTGTTYWIGLESRWPLQSWMQWLSGPTQSMGVLAWAVLVYFIGTAILRGQKLKSSRTHADNPHLGVAG